MQLQKLIARQLYFIPLHNAYCANWHQNQFIHFLNIMITSLVIDKHSNGLGM